jgi:hypothetical protein
MTKRLVGLASPHDPLACHRQARRAFLPEFSKRLIEELEKHKPDRIVIAPSCGDYARRG